MLDINLNTAKTKFCNGWIRRDFLRVGAIAPLGFSLANLLAAQSANAAPETTAAQSARGARRRAEARTVDGRRTGDRGP